MGPGNPRLDRTRGSIRRTDSMAAPFVVYLALWLLFQDPAGDGGGEKRRDEMPHVPSLSEARV